VSVVTSLIARTHQSPVNVTQVSGAVGEIENIAQETAAAVERIGSASAQIASQTHTIRERVGAFTEHIRAMRA